MSSDQAFRWRTREQCLKRGNHRFLYYALCRQHHGFITFDLNYEFVVHLEHDLRLARQCCAELRIDADQRLDGNFRRGTLNR